MSDYQLYIDSEFASPLMVAGSTQSTRPPGRSGPRLRRLPKPTWTAPCGRLAVRWWKGSGRP